MALPTEAFSVSVAPPFGEVGYRNAATVTPHDDNDLAHSADALYIGEAGDVAVIMYPALAPVVFKAVPAGTFLRINVRRVMATGTDSLSIVALWR